MINPQLRYSKEHQELKNTNKILKDPSLYQKVYFSQLIRFS